jgi:hypothetical protein
MNEALYREAMLIYGRVAKTYGLDQPSHTDSTEEDGFIVLRNVKGELGRYKISEGVLWTNLTDPAGEKLGFC